MIENIKKIIVVLIIIIISIFLILKLINTKKNDTTLYVDLNVRKIEPVDDYEKYKRYVDNYLTKILNGDNEVYNLLDRKYIEKNEVTINNVIEKLNCFKEFKTIKIKEVYYKSIKYDEYEQAYIHYITLDDNENELEKYYITINFDLLNYVYSIKPYNVDSIEKMIDIENEIEKNYSIEINEYNKI